MKFDLSVATVLVFFVPGAIFLFGAPVSLGDAVDALRQPSIWGTTSSTLGTFSAVFVLGAFMDSIRTQFVQPLIKWWAEGGDKGVKLKENHLRSLGPAQLELYEMVARRSHEYYRLNANILTALLAVCLLFFVAVTSSITGFTHIFAFTNGTNAEHIVVPLVGLAAWTPIAITSKRYSNLAVQDFIDQALPSSQPN